MIQDAGDVAPCRQGHLISTGTSVTALEGTEEKKGRTSLLLYVLAA